MGTVISALKRPGRYFNVEHRAHKIISKEKPTPSPTYESTLKQKKLMDELHPGFQNEMLKRDDSLDKRLKDVFVVAREKGDGDKFQHLPQERSYVPKWDMENYEPSIIPAGKCTLKGTICFISLHKNNPEIYTAEKIAADYKIDKYVVADILKHFKLVSVNKQPPENLRIESKEKGDP